MAATWKPLRGAPPPDGTVVFQYLGRTSLAIVSPITGITYRFGHPGAQAAAPALDRHYLNAVPVLREMAGG